MVISWWSCRADWPRIRRGPSWRAITWLLLAVALPGTAAEPALTRTFELSTEYRSYRGSYPGAGEQHGWQLHLAPGLEWQARSGKTLLARIDVPLYRQPPFWRLHDTHPLFTPYQDYSDYLLRQSRHITANSGMFVNGHDHMADISLDIAYGRLADRGSTLLPGLLVVLPANEDQSNGRHQGLLGPTLTWLTTTRRARVGTRLSHVMDVYNTRAFKTSESQVQLLYAHQLGRGWQAIARPTLIYDWRGDRGNRLMLPLGGGIAWSGSALHISLEAYQYAKTTERFGVSRLIKLSLSPWPGAQHAHLLQL